MSITLPTLDELEAWWEAHPTTEAITCDECRCIIAHPLMERCVESRVLNYPVTVLPSRVLSDGTRREGKVTIHHIAGDEEIPLPEDLNHLAKEFDRLGDSMADEDGLIDQHEINAADCVALIRQVRGEL